MAMKPNYRMERANRTRNKERKKQEKLRQREEDTARRKALLAGQAGDATATETGTAIGREPEENGL